MTRTVTRLFDTYSAAENAVAELERMGIPHRDIGLVADNSDKAHDHRGPRRPDGQTAGVGGGGGALAGLAMLAIPGLGPVVAMGWLASTAADAVGGAAAGGAAGGLVGALSHGDVSPEDAQVYAEAVRRGGTVVGVKVADDRSMAVESALDNFGPVDVVTLGLAYRERGWRRCGEKAVPLSRKGLAAEQAHHAFRQSRARTARSSQAPSAG